MSPIVTAISPVLDALARVPFIAGALTKGTLLVLIAIGATLPHRAWFWAHVALSAIGAAIFAAHRARTFRLPAVVRYAGVFAVFGAVAYELFEEAVTHAHLPGGQDHRGVVRTPHGRA